jgi:hypothetical protein
MALYTELRAACLDSTVVDVEARARLSSALDVAGREGAALDALRDGRLTAVLEAMNTLRAEIVAALAALSEAPEQ